MNRLFLYLSVLLLSTGCGRGDGTFEVSGTIVGDTTGTVVLTQAGQPLSNVAVSSIVDGKFHITGIHLNDPELYLLFQEKWESGIVNPLHLFVSPGERIRVAFNTEEPESSVVDGAKLDAEYRKYLHSIESHGEERLDSLKTAYESAVTTNDSLRMKEIEEQGRGFYAENEREKIKKILKYIQTNPSSYISVYALHRHAMSLGDEQIGEMTEVLDEKLHNSKYYYGIVNAHRNQPGKKADDFTLKDARDEDFVFSEFSRNKVILIDFWASWCRPCRASNPKLQMIYQKYKDRGFEIVGISLDDNWKNLKRAVEADGITWTNLLDNNEIAALYNRTSLPAYILIDRSGTVVGRFDESSGIEDELVKILN